MATVKDIETWFLRALDVPDSGRKKFLETHLHEQTDLLDEVLELVQRKDEDLLTQLKNELSGEMEEQITPEIDRYNLVEEIGKGGMAMVYLAERTDGVFDHEVAVKVLRLGRNSEDFVSRFNQERNVLGRLKHENIAQIYDGGVTTDGRPYFVMELVSGRDIVEYADAENLPLKSRLHLFLNACKAIHFAHQNLVIHRDIKPSNILINTRGQVKLTDFGIAQLMDVDIKNVDNADDSFLLTPGYASPEQINLQNVDIRTDVYQLGIVLGELLKGVKPPRDLKLLMMRAIRKEKKDRYQSTNELITDIENFLSNKPLSVRRGSWTYATSKFVRRHKIGVGASLLILLVLLASTTLYIIRINQANEKIRFEKNIAESSVNLFLAIFSNAYPSYAKGDTLNVFDLLDIGDSLLVYSKSDLLSGRFSQLMGEIYSGYNRFPEAVPYYRNAINYLKKDSNTLAEKRNMLFAAQASLVNPYIALGKLDSAFYFLQESDRYAAMNELKNLHQPALYGKLAWLEVNRGNHERADALYRKAVKLHAEGSDLLALASLMSYYARYLNYYDTPGRKDQIDSLYTASMRVFEENGLDSTRKDDYARVVNFIGIFNMDLKNYAEAERHFQKAYEINLKLFGTDNLATLDNLNNLAQIQIQKENYSDAQENFLVCWQAAQRLNIPLLSSLVYYHNYAKTFNLLEQYDVAMVKFDSLVIIRETSVSQDVMRLNSARFELAASYAGLKKYQKAEDLFLLIKTIHVEEFGGKGDLDLRATIELVKIYRKTGQVEKAAELSTENKNRIIDRVGEDSELIKLNEEANAI